MPRSLINASSICIGMLLTIYALLSTFFQVQQRAQAAYKDISLLSEVIYTQDEQVVTRQPELDYSTPSNRQNPLSGKLGLRSERELTHQPVPTQIRFTNNESLPNRPGGIKFFKPEIPVRIVIPVIDLDAPIQPVDPLIGQLTSQDQHDAQKGQVYRQWPVPDFFAAGWHSDSARLGEIGNTILNGHHNISGKVFGRLVELEPGDVIQIYSKESLFSYLITNKMILPEKYQEIDVRMTNAQWILPSQDERVTLITCWPEQSNTHRLIIVARPVARQNLNSPEKPLATYK